MLTQNEKDILGIMTDEGRLRGALRLEVAASDDKAREEIAKYKTERLNNINNELTFLNTRLAELTQQKQLLENV